MKIYTKTGDDGTTALFGGDRISKDHLRVEAYGTVDELNSFLGVLIDQLNEAEIKTFISSIQHVLFNLGSVIATTDDRMLAKLPKLLDTDIEALEKAMDAYERDLEPMTNFVLPSGQAQVSAAHVCRTVCRRAERCLVRLSHTETVSEDILRGIKLLNRLSDYFFVLARKLTQLNHAVEVIWNKNTTIYHN